MTDHKYDITAWIGQQPAIVRRYILKLQDRALPQYEGWKNYPTWCVNLWLTNDEGLYREALGVVRTAIASVHHGDRPCTLEQATRFDVEDAFKEWVEERGMFDDVGGFAADLGGWALAQVDWREIAEAWIEMVDETRKNDSTKKSG